MSFQAAVRLFGASVSFSCGTGTVSAIAGRLLIAHWAPTSLYVFSGPNACGYLAQYRSGQSMARIDGQKLQAGTANPASAMLIRLPRMWISSPQSQARPHGIAEPNEKPCTEWVSVIRILAFVHDRLFMRGFELSGIFVQGKHIAAASQIDGWPQHFSHEHSKRDRSLLLLLHRFEPILLTGFCVAAQAAPPPHTLLECRLAGGRSRPPGRRLVDCQVLGPTFVGVAGT